MIYLLCVVYQYRTLWFLSDENDFIEISVDPYNIKPDEELFPSSVFTQVKDDSSKEKGITEESRHIPQTEEADELTVDSTDNSVIITDDNEFEGMSHVGWIIAW